MKKISSIGFTLLELLVVIGIIGVILGLGSVSYSSAQKKARDARRKGDLQDFQKGFEQYYSQCGYKYGNDGTDWAPPANPWAQTDLWGDLKSCIDGSIILKARTDPLTGGWYQGYNVTYQEYTICPPVVAGTDKLLETEDCTVTTKTCCLTNQQ